MTAHQEFDIEVKGERSRISTRLGVTLLAATVLVSTSAVWNVVRPPHAADAGPLVVNDASQLNPITVARVITPRTTQEIVEAVTHGTGPVTIRGARHSMRGQIATSGALHVDMRQFDRILAFSRVDKTITVQAGARWRQIQERIDPSR